ncbi:MAG TPA: mechanosensitive ion channel, partial [Spirochaetota bacterium]|nr:mechanosensitive ion channel [Spirochaetota bacterium]
MQELIVRVISKIGFPENLTNVLALIASLIILIFIALLLSLIFNFIIIKIIRKIVKKTAVKWDDIIFNEIFLKRLTRLVPIIILYSTFNLFLTENSKISIAVQKILLSLLVFFSIRIIDTAIKNANKVYETFPISKKTPIKGYIQLFQIFLYIIAVILIISILFNKDPLGLLSGIGALTAVLLLVFKDGILGFVAALQINANDMVNIGDWIEAPAYGADGDVIEISLTTIKVQNWDKTISTIPTYALVSGSFKNWRGMNEAKGRRIKRSLSIDVNSIKFLDQELINKLSAIRLLNGYLTEKQNEIDISNSKLGIDQDDLLNGRRLTN